MPFTFACTVIPNGFDSLRKNASFLVELSPHCDHGETFSADWKAWGAYLGTAPSAADDVWKLKIDGVDVDAKYVSRGRVDVNAWNVLLADAIVACSWSERLLRQRRRFSTNYAAAASHFQRLRYARHFDALAERLLGPTPPRQESKPSNVNFDPDRPLGLFAAGNVRPDSESNKPIQTNDEPATAGDRVLLRAAAGRPLTLFTKKATGAAGLIDQCSAPRPRDAEHPVTGKTRSVSGENISEAEAVIGMLAFHGRVPEHPDAPSRKRAMKAAPLCDTFDFHEQIAILKGYPSLLFPLGLVIELHVDAQSVPHRDFTVRAGAAPGALASHITVGGPATLVDASMHAKDAATREWLPLQVKERFQLTSFDADASTLKYAQHDRQQSADTFLDTPPPSRHSVGISLLDTQRCDKLRERVELSRDADLEARDLVRGWIAEVRRVDKDHATDWLSLSERNEAFVYGKDEQSTDRIKLPPAHGLIRSAATRVTDRISNAEAKTEDLHVGETVFRWDGWSLALPSPFGQEMPGAGADKQPTDEKKTPWYLRPEYSAQPGTLVPLRFGGTYQFRVRAANAVGSPLGDGRNADDNTSDEVRYLRHDPVLPPQFLLSQSLDLTAKPGESLHRLVLPKPTRDMRTEAVTRCMVPPITTFRIAEQHGVYDCLTEKETPRTIGGYREVLLEPGCDGSWSLPSEKGTPLYRPPRALTTRPFLPDPLAKYVCVRVEDLVTGDSLELEPMPFYAKAWPDAKLLRFELRAREDGRARVGAAWDVDRGIVIVSLPPAWVAQVSVSCGFEEGDLDCIGAYSEWAAIVDSDDAATRACVKLAPAARDAVAHRVICGCHEMVSPARELTLIHPVLRPLSDPVVASMLVTRAPSATDAVLETTFRFDRKSTGRIAVNARWEEWHDVPAEGPPKRVAKTAHVPHVYIVNGKKESSPHIALRSPSDAKDFEPRDASSETVSLVHSLADSHARKVTYQATAFSRFEQELVPRADEKTTRESEPVVSLIPSSARPPAPVVRYVIPAFSWERGSESVPTDPTRIATARRRPVLRVWLERPWHASGDDEMLAVVLWPSITQDQAERLNRGGATATMPPRTVPEDLEPLVTRWGMDPIWNGRPTTAAPTPNHFPGAHFVSGLLVPPPAAKKQEALPFEKTPPPPPEPPPPTEHFAIPDADKLVSVAAYQVSWSLERNAWFCDITLDSVPSYWTFLRLALCRYQPNSNPGCELSPVNLIDFVQIVPDRTVNVMRFPEDRHAYQVEIFGEASGPACDDRIKPNRYEVAVERRCRLSHGYSVWMPDPEVMVTPRQRATDALWSATVRMRGTTDDRRLVVCEFEQFDADGPDESQTVPVSRLIYADALEL